MGLEGLSKYKQQKEEQTKNRSSDPRLLRIEDGQTVRVRPLQELDDDRKNYIKENGAARFATVVNRPDKFWLECEDTYAAENKSVAHEMRMAGLDARRAAGNKEPWKGYNDWRTKDKVYLNVLVDDGENDPEVKILVTTMGDKVAVWSALEQVDEDNGTITDRWFKYSRKGTGQTGTNYKFVPQDKDDSLEKADAYKLLNPDDFIKKVPYEEQRAFFELGSSPTSAPVVSEATQDEDW